MVSQNLLNIVDTAMVGFLGDSALAAVGLGGFVSFIPPRARKAKAGSIAP
jgi:Na+-driven multidrug efflux pump